MTFTIQVGDASAGGLRMLDPLIVEIMAATVVGRTREALIAQFEISYNTWRKIEANMPIRLSLAERIEKKV